MVIQQINIKKTSWRAQGNFLLLMPHVYCSYILAKFWQNNQTILKILNYWNSNAHACILNYHKEITTLIFFCFWMLNTKAFKSNESIHYFQNEMTTILSLYNYLSSVLLRHGVFHMWYYKSIFCNISFNA